MRCQLLALLPLVLLSVSLMTGCQGPSHKTLGMSVEGRPVKLVDLGGHGDVVLIMGAIHGDERATYPLVQRLEAYLLAHPELLDDRRVILMPLANPDGYAAGTRHNANDIDLNRNFPADNFDASADHGPAPLCEPESRIIKAVLDEYRPDRIVSIHQPYDVIDYDGPAEDLARAMGRWTDMPVKRVGSRPGSLGSYAGLNLGIPIITLELPESASDLTIDELWTQYGPTLLAAIRFPEDDIGMH